MPLPALLPLLPLLSAGGGLLSAGVSAFQGRRSRQRMDRFNTGQMGRNLEAEATGSTADQVAALRQRGAALEKQAFRQGLGDAAERGVAAGSEPGGVSGVAQQAIDPLLADVRSRTESDIMTTITSRREELERQRAAAIAANQASEAARPRGVFGALFS